MSENIPCDAVTVCDRLDSHDMLSQVGGISYISGLIDTIVSTSNAEYYAKLVREKASIREGIQTAQQIVFDGYNAENGSEFIEKAEQKILSIRHISGKEPVSIQTALQKSAKLLQARMEQGSEITGVSTGLKDLDIRTCGLQPSDLVVLAARPSMGKTALAGEIALSAAQQGHVLFFSLEMSMEQLTDRMIANYSGISGQSIRTGKIRHQDFDDLQSGIARLARLNLSIDDDASISLLEMRSKCRRAMSKEGKISLVVIDYLQLMSNPVSPSREREIADISRGLKVMAKELNCPVLCLSQLNRKVEERADKRPLLSDLRESGSIEQDADVVLMLYRDEYYNEASPDAGLVEVIIRKQRNGSVGAFKACFSGEMSQVRDLEGSY